MRETFANTRFCEIFKYSVDKLSQNANKEEYCEINFHESSKFVAEDVFCKPEAIKYDEAQKSS